MIDAYMPSIEEARHRLIAEIRQARENGVAVLKIIHEYGSTGKGGTLVELCAPRSSTAKKKAASSSAKNGESLKTTLATRLTFARSFARDRDLNRSNPGISFALLV